MVVLISIERVRDRKESAMDAVFNQKRSNVLIARNDEAHDNPKQKANGHCESPDRLLVRHQFE